MVWDIDRHEGVWMAFYPGVDGGPGVPFQTEVQALRFALDLHMNVRFARFGDSDWAKDKPERTL